MSPTCAAHRNAHFVLSGSEPAHLKPPRPEAWPQITWDAGPRARRVNLDTVSAEDVAQWQPGETLLLSGKMLTGRDAAHKRTVEMFDRGESLHEGVDLKGGFI